MKLFLSHELDSEVCSREEGGEKKNQILPLSLISMPLYLVFTVTKKRKVASILVIKMELIWLTFNLIGISVPKSKMLFLNYDCILMCCRVGVFFGFCLAIQETVARK